MRGDAVVFRWAREGECGVCGAAIQTSEVVDVVAGEARFAELCDACVDRFGGLYPASFERRVRLLATPLYSASCGCGGPATVRCGSACEHGVESYVEEPWRGGLRFTCPCGAKLPTRVFRCTACGVAVPERAVDLFVTASDPRAVGWQVVSEAEFKAEALARQSRIAFGMMTGLSFCIVAGVIIVGTQSLPELYKQFNMEMPGPTLAVLGLADDLVQWWPLTFGGIVWVSRLAAKHVRPTPVARAVMDVALAVTVGFIVLTILMPFHTICGGIRG